MRLLHKSLALRYSCWVAKVPFTQRQDTCVDNPSFSVRAAELRYLPVSTVEADGAAVLGEVQATVQTLSVKENRARVLTVDCA